MCKARSKANNDRSRTETPRKPDNLAREKIPSPENLSDDWISDKENVDFMADSGRSMKSTRSVKGKRTKFANAPEVAYVNKFLQDGGVKTLVGEFEALKRYMLPSATTEVFKANRDKNRYNDVPCIDQTRVALKKRTISQDYIHANFVKLSDSESPPRYICTQGPKENTVVDFWHMVVQEKVHCVVMLCQCVEKEKPKCAPYYPSADKVATYGDFKVSNRGPLTAENAPSGTFLHNLEVESHLVVHRLTHIQWTEWPDHTAPNETEPVFQLVQLAKKYNKGQPIVVHCSAGIGRTGTFVLLDMMEELFKNYEGKTIPDMIHYLRDQRASVIQTAPQYVFAHLAAIDLVVKKHGPLAETSKMRHFRTHFVRYQEAVKRLQEEALAVRRQGTKTKEKTKGATQENQPDEGANQ